MDITPISLYGKVIDLVPLTETHVGDLTMVGLEKRIWRYMIYGDIQTEAEMRAWVFEMLRRQSDYGDLPFAVIHKETSRAIGATRYLNIRIEHRGLEIGGTWYGVNYQGSVVNPEAKYLLLKHAFEDLDCIRVQLKTDLRNITSQRAIERLGAKKEGVLRKHIICPDGYFRDSVIYSIVEPEWAKIKSALEGRIESKLKVG